MRIYVATSIRNKEWALEACRRIDNETMHVVTYNWAEVCKEDTKSTPAEAFQAGILDLYLGVQTADLIIANADNERMLGALIEMGAAIAWGKRIWVLKPYRYSIFWELPNVEWLTSEELMWEELGWPL